MNILILGAGGQIAHHVIDLLQERPDVRLTLYSRNPALFRRFNLPSHTRVLNGDVMDEHRLIRAMAGQDVVYANLSGELEEQAQEIVSAMKTTSVSRLIFITSMGIYDEVPGEQYGTILEPYRGAAKVIEASDLDFTIVRPAWLNDDNEISYGVTRKGEPFKNASKTVSRRSVADLVVKLATTSGLESGQSLGVHKT
ncbi:MULTISPECIES: NAD(P)H-binding protein [unclassified Pseudomonas]|uniref:NAD(P)H-binding protein n=1 Tax=unclassified Pseudomonas TaxID=196821 RepID=UPI002113EFBA|nr:MULTISPECIES: NAD(P)H-binding protein [unclassified Pseudomonas]